MNEHEKAIQTAIQNDDVTYFQTFDESSINAPILVASQKGGENYERKTTILCHSAREGKENIVRWLINNRSTNKVNIEGQDEDLNTALSLAIEFGHTAIVKDLIKAGANVNMENKFGNGPLHQMAFKVNDDELINLIINKSANINVTNKGDETALSIAAVKGNEKALNALLEAGASFDIVNKKAGDNPFHQAARTGKLKCMEIIQKTFPDIDIDKTNKNNYTALHFAAENGHIDAVKWLIEKKADVFAECKVERNGKYYLRNPLELAARSKDVKVVGELLQVMEEKLPADPAKFIKSIETTRELINKNNRADEIAKKEVLEKLDTCLSSINKKVSDDSNKQSSALGRHGSFRNTSPTQPDEKTQSGPKPK